MSNYCKNCYELTEQLDQLKAQLLDQEAETLKAGGIIHKLEQTLTEIKEIAKIRKDDINDWLAKEILQKISKCEGDDE